MQLNDSVRRDIKWWLLYLPSWSGVSVFMDDYWTRSVEINFYTDASDLAISGYYDGEWYFVPLSDAQRNASINWRELYAVVVAVATWGSQLKSKQILLHCDNMVVCNILKKGTSKNEHLMELVRMLFYISAHYNLLCSAMHIPTHDNSIADSLSRFQFNRFRRLAPMANPHMTIPCMQGVEPNLSHSYCK